MVRLKQIQLREMMSDKDWDLLNKQMVGFLRLWVDDSVYDHIYKETKAQSLWKKMEELYGRKTVGNKAFLIQKLVNLKYKKRLQLQKI